MSRRETLIILVKWYSKDKLKLKELTKDTLSNHKHDKQNSLLSTFSLFHFLKATKHLPSSNAIESLHE